MSSTNFEILGCIAIFQCDFSTVINNIGSTVKLGFKELFNKEQIGNSEPFSVTNLPVYLINSEQMALVNNFAMAKKFLNAKFDCTSISMIIVVEFRAKQDTVRRYMPTDEFQANYFFIKIDLD
jgi:hypothetical protein